MFYLKISLVATLVLTSLVSQAQVFDYSRYEKGFFWCNKQRWNEKTFGSRHLTVAKRGYLYTVAAALSLQKENQEGKDHFFQLLRD